MRLNLASCSFFKAEVVTRLVLFCFLELVRRVVIEPGRICPGRPGSREYRRIVLHRRNDLGVLWAMLGLFVEPASVQDVAACMSDTVSK